MSMRGYGHDLEGIVDAALTLLDEYGLPDLSMRKLATHLGVQPSALYWHVANKQTLLAAVADRIVAGSGPAAAPAPVTETAWALRAALLRHRDGAEVVVSTAALSLGSGVLEGRLRAAYEAAGSPDPARDATVLAQFLLGHTYLVQQRMQAASIGAYDADPAQVAESTRADFAAGLRALAPGVR
ncbi:MAG: TetR family transcriptional regulator [Microbacterium gubbeenense]|uniref:TetR family transcriptional regulator n=1 Tax=Microbacterium gubbeenense TaxID=159896 RepID=UPI0003F62580